MKKSMITTAVAAGRRSRRCGSLRRRVVDQHDARTRAHLSFRGEDDNHDRRHLHDHRRPRHRHPHHQRHHADNHRRPQSPESLSTDTPTTNATTPTTIDDHGTDTPTTNATTPTTIDDHGTDTHHQRHHAHDHRRPRRQAQPFGARFGAQLTQLGQVAVASLGPGFRRLPSHRTTATRHCRQRIGPRQARRSFEHEGNRMPEARQPSRNAIDASPRVARSRPPVRCAA